jgi:hypothetical protein
MLKIAKVGVVNAVLLFACAVSLQAAETRTPTPEEFREQVRKYNESGAIPGSQRPPQVVTQQSKAVEQYRRAVALHTKKDASPRELKEAAALYQAASDAGIPEASSNLALLYLEGKGVKKDVKKTLSLLQAASKKGVTQADVMLARMYLTGNGVKKDEKKGEQLLEKAAKTGNQNAVKTLAEYREWKKKNEQAMQQYQELLKKAQLNQAKPQTITLPQPSGGFPAQPGPEPPFSVIPGQSYLGMNPLFNPAAPLPQAPAVVNIVPKGDSPAPQAVKLQAPAEPGKDKGLIQMQPKPVGQQKPETIP